MVNADEVLVFGVHWFNNDDCRVDLDLSVNYFDTENENDFSSGKITNFSWMSSFTDGKNIIHTGDVTNAPKSRGGAAELILSNLDKGYARVSLYDYTRRGCEKCQLVVSSISKEFAERLHHSNKKEIPSMMNLQNSIINIPIKVEPGMRIDLGILDYYNKRFIFTDKVKVNSPLPIIYQSSDMLTLVNALMIANNSLRIKDLLELYSEMDKFELISFTNREEIEKEIHQMVEDEVIESENEVLILDFSTFNLAEFENLFM
jgi:hypothetical protein